MTARNLERIFGTTARDLFTSIEAGPQGGAIRTQAAVVHSVIDQIRYHDPSDGCVAFLRDQAKEELLRLVRGMKMHAPVQNVVLSLKA